MPAQLVDYRAALDEILATAVDASTWTTAIKDQALRTALTEYDQHFTYESSLTVSDTGHAQNISSLDAIKDVLAVAYPWTDGADFAARQQRWRYADDQILYFEEAEPHSGEVLRVRHTRAHRIQDLDAATVTTVPTHHMQLLAILAASYACLFRVRQVSENPAIPQRAADLLQGVGRRFSAQAAQLLSSAQRKESVSWMEIGL